jgi:hypothetical protein
VADIALAEVDADGAAIVELLPDGGARIIEVHGVAR